MEVSIYSITSGVLIFWCIGIIQRHMKSGGPNVRSIFMDGIIEVVPGRKEAGMGLCVTRSIYHSLSWVNIIPFLYFVQPMHSHASYYKCVIVTMGQSKFAETP